MRKAIGTLVAAAGLLAAAQIAAADDDHLEWSGHLAPGEVLEVRGVLGNIQAELTRGSTAEVSAEKIGRERDFDKIEIRLEETRDGVIVCAYQRGQRRGEHGCDRDGGEYNTGVRVNFRVLLPAGVELVARTVAGDVEAQGLRSRVDASTVDGDVVISTSETARGSTVSGDIEIEMGATDGDDLHFRTVSGDITLVLPTGLDADVEFESLSGDLRSDFEISDYRERKKGLVGSRIRGVIGNGGPRLSMETISGDVRLRRN